MEGKIILGLTEKIKIIGKKEEKEIVARIDTGATNSSIDMSLAEELKLGPIIRTKLVKSASGRKMRPLILVKIKLNGDMLEGEFSIAERKHMTYPVLIGQNILKKGNFLVDPNKD